MKKDVTVKILIGLGVLLLFFVLFNQLDSPPPPDVFTESDWLPVTFDKNNGFYLVLAFTEPPGVDVESDEIITKYRRLFDPRLDNEHFMARWDYYGHRRKFDEYERKARFIHGLITDWVDFCVKRKNEIEQLSKQLSVFLERYGKLLERDVVSDFSVPRFWIDGQALITVSKLYTALMVKDAVEGSEEGSVSALLKQLKFSKKLIKSARSPAVNYVGKVIMQVSLKGINSLMNREGCSPELFSRVFEFLTPITYEEYGSRNGFVGLYLAYDWWFNNQLDKNIERGNIVIGSRLGRAARLFLQTRRTLNYYFAYISKCIDYEKRPPFEWESDQITAESINKGLFWWLRNPAGKLVFSDKNYLKPDLTNRILASIETKIIYELVRISAEIHLRKASGAVDKEIPGKLESYRALDPYSGKPYKWNSEKGILYSLGPNRKDDGGQFDPTRHTRNEPPDIVLRCVLWNVRD